MRWRDIAFAVLFSSVVAVAVEIAYDAPRWASVYFGVLMALIFIGKGK